MLAFQPNNQQQQLISPITSTGLPKYSLVEPMGHPTNALVVYLSNSIKRDVRLLAAMGLIKESGMKVINSYLPYASAATSISSGDEESAIMRALSDSNSTLPLNTSLESVQRPASAFDQSVDSLPNMSEDPKRIIAQMKKLNRQRSETAPLRPVQKHDHSPDQHQSQNQLHQLHLQIQRGPSSPRKEKTHKHEGLSAKLGAFFNKLTLDAETSPRLKSTKGLAFTPVNSPRTPGFPAHQLGASAASVAFPKYPGTMGFQKPASTCGAANDAAKRSNERSLSDAPKSPQISRISAAVKTEPRLTHRVTVSHCQAPALGIAPRQHQQLLRLEQEHLRKASQSSQLSGVSCTDSTATAGYSSTDSVRSGSGSGSGSDAASSARSSHISSKASKASTLATRKRSFTHLGLSMELMSADQGEAQQSTSSRGPQLRRTKPAANISALQAKLVSPCGMSEGMARLAAPTNSLGLVIQTSAAAIAAKPRPLPLATPIRAQRHHNSFSALHKEPKSPTSVARIQGGLSSIASSRNPTSPTKAAAPSTLAFPPMPSEACQLAMLSASTGSLQHALAAEQADAQRSAQQTPPPYLNKAFSESIVDKSLAAMVLVATAAYDYTSSIKGDLEFTRGERIVIQSKVNDD
ncbi:hypothetical protein GGF37_004851, partial [Kickxella alabastrina]